jgi:Icc protein
MEGSRRILQLSDPHLLADPEAHFRERAPLVMLRHALAQALALVCLDGPGPDLLLISGDLCQDESWAGYVRLGQVLEELVPSLPVALLAGNHDQILFLGAVLGRRAVVAPYALALGPWELLLLDSHRPGQTAGWLGHRQLEWLERHLASGHAPVLVAVHHPPVPIGDSFFDGIALKDGDRLMECLRPSGRVQGLVFGHVHQHWHGTREDGAMELWGCPSTLCGFGPVQPCPLGRADDPGGRLLELHPWGEIRQRLLRWSLPDPPNLVG